MLPERLERTTLRRIDSHTSADVSAPVRLGPANSYWWWYMDH
jgi:hypothetical protein